MPAPVRSAPAPSFSSPSAAAMPVMNPSKPAVPALPKRKKKEDPEDRALRMRKYRRNAIIAIGFCFLFYYGVGFAWDLVPATKNPFPSYTAEEFAGEYSKDKLSADDLFADKVVVVTGSLTVTKESGAGKATPKVYFTAANSGDFKVEVQFHDMDITTELKDGTTYRVSGRVQKFKPGTPITLKSANLLLGDGASAPIRARDTAARRIEFPHSHQLPVEASRVPHT